MITQREKERISSFFDKMSGEEFQKMLEKNGMGIIKKREDSSYFKAFSVEFVDTKAEYIGKMAYTYNQKYLSYKLNDKEVA